MNDTVAHVMVTTAEIVERDGVTRQAVSKQVRKLADGGMPVERDSRGRITKFSQAWYDEHREKFTDPSQVRQRKEVPSHPPGNSFDEARRIQAWLAVDRDNLKKQEAAGQLVRKDRFEAALEQAGVAIQSAVSKLPNRADDLATALAKEGVHGLRLALRQVAFDINTAIADNLAQIAVEAPESDQLIETENV